MTLTDYSITWRHATGSRKWVARVCFEYKGASLAIDLVTDFTEKAEAEAYVLHKIPETRAHLYYHHDELLRRQNHVY